MRGARTLAAALLLVGGCASNGGRERAILQSPDQDAYAIAASLVTEVGPRFAGSDGDAAAVKWGVAKLTELGFQNVRAEPVTVPHWVRGAIAVEMKQPRRQTLDAVALGGSVASPPGGVEAAVVAVASVDAVDAMPAEAIRGRIVYFSGHTERARDGSGYGKAVPARRNGPSAAARKGALAVLIRSIGTDTDGPPHTGMTFYVDDAPRIPAAALSQAAADQLEKELATGKPVRVRVLINSEMRGEAPSANVIGEIPGVTDEIVLLGAHRDSWDITPGANDDAAGIGIVVAAARRVAALGTPRRTLRVVLYANEEFGVSGGKAYAQVHAGEADQHVLVMEADSGSGAPWKLNGVVAEADFPEVARLATGLGLEAEASGKHGGTDVGEMRQFGIPEIIVMQDSSRYFDVHHTRADTIETLDRDGLVKTTAVFAQVVHAICERKERLLPNPPPKPAH